MIENEDLKKSVVGKTPMDTNHSVLTQEQKDRLEDYINWKLKDIDWWAGSGLTLSGKVEIAKMIEDHDFHLMEYHLAGQFPRAPKIYDLYSDCDRYRFEISILFNEDATEFYFNDPY